MNYLALILVCFSDVETDLQLARARANLVSIEVREPVKAAIGLLPILQEKKQRLQVVMLTKKSCQPCKVAKAALEGSKVDYEICELVIQEEDTRPVPQFLWSSLEEVNEFPVRMQIIGWWGVDHLTKEINRTRKSGFSSKLKQQTVRQQFNSYNPRWTWPGNLGSHLQSSHGINTNGMSQDDMERAHDNAHEGKGRR